MAEHIEKTIADLQSRLKEQEEVVNKTKVMINQLCEITGKRPLYSELEFGTTSQPQNISSDQFYGQPLNKSMRSILEMRKAIGNGPSTPKEIYEALIEGGYAFETENVQNRLTTVRTALRKSSTVFHPLPDKKRYGLLSWYPNAKNKKVQSNTDNDGVVQTSLYDADPEVPE